MRRPSVRAARAVVAARLDRPAEKLLARLLRRRLRRLTATRMRDLATPRSTWDPEIYEAQERLVRRYAPGRSFVDIGCMWGVDGACAFLAEASGATEVTAMDKWPRTAAYLAKEERFKSSVRFVQGDLHKEETIEAIGVHDVVWCSGLLYHTPHPVQTMTQLLRLAREYLIVGTKSVPDVPNLPGLAVYYPGLDEEQRSTYRPLAGRGLDKPFDPALYAVNWFWGLSPEALISIARSIAGVDVVERVDLPWGRRHDDVYLVLRLQSAAGLHVISPHDLD